MCQWNPDVVTGEFEHGGDFQVKDNAHGEILRCEPPSMFRVSWIYEENYSELEVRIDAVDDQTSMVEIEHIMREEDLANAGMSLRQGIVGAGMGWDMTLNYLGQYLASELDEPSTEDRGCDPIPADADLYNQFEKAWQEVADNSISDHI